MYLTCVKLVLLKFMFQLVDSGVFYLKALWKSIFLSRCCITDRITLQGNWKHSRDVIFIYWRILTGTSLVFS